MLRREPVQPMLEFELLDSGEQPFILCDDLLTLLVHFI